MTDDARRYTRVHEILRGTLELEGAALDAYLDEHCGSDGSLRDAVLELRAAGLDEVAGDPFDEGRVHAHRAALKSLLPDSGAGVAAEHAGAATRSAKQHDPSLLLQRLGQQASGPSRYTMEAKIAEGGQGTIYRVWDGELQRSVAMKVMLRRADSRGSGHSPASVSLGRFLEEAQVTGRLEHPGIVPVHELGLDAQGRVYFTMRLVDGQTLSSVLESAGRGADGWNQPRVLGVLLRVCEAMAYAHDRGVIHRDLKPSNIMVGSFGEVFVMDWGLARLLKQAATGGEGGDARKTHGEPTADSDAGSGPDSGPRTLEGTVIGTPQYMPPEQASGTIDDMGPASDVYSVGAMLYEILAGRPPYVGAGRPPTARQLVGRVQAGAPEPLEKVAPGAPPELLAICRRAMERSPSERYPDMASLATDVRAFLEGRVVRAFEAGALAELRKWIVRNRWLAAAFGTAALAVVVGLIVALALKKQAEDSRDAVLRLSALQDVEDLLQESRRLWPVLPERVPEYEAWIARARKLEEELPLYIDLRDRIRAKGEPPAEADPRANPMAREPWLAQEQQDWRFPESEGEARWWNNQLSKLIADIGVLSRLLVEGSESASPGFGWSIPRRTAFAERVRAGFAPGGQYAQLWDSALPAIRSAYPTLDAAPQVGLVPIGPDPESGLWEFADLATGEVPERDARGQLQLAERSSVVFVLLPGGTFHMGAQSRDAAAPNYDAGAQSNEGPVHEVSLSPFLLSKFEMTQAQWLALMGDNPSVYKPPNPLVASLAHPVETVDWYACSEACARLGWALPTESQWEYAARAGTSSAYWTGAESTTLPAHSAANVADRSAERGTSWTVLFEPWEDGSVLHAPVGSRSPNPFGLHDVHGNVWEWTRDAFSPDFYSRGPVTDPHNDPTPSARIVYRGGAFNAPAASARSAYRDFDAPTLSHNSTGFRPARAWER